MGTTKNTTRSWNAYGDRTTTAKGGSAIASRATRDMGNSGFDPNAITYVKTFEVQRTDSDEMELMHVDEFGQKSPRLKSSSTSVASL
jgi:hypothetical protein